MSSPNNNSDRPPLWRRRWFVVTAVIVGLLVLIVALSDPEQPSDRAATAGETPAPTATPTPTPDPAAAARLRATELAADGSYFKAVTVLEVAGLDRAADRVARRGAQALYRRAQRAFAAGRFAAARRTAADAMDLHRTKAARALIATADEEIAAARAAAALARDQRTCDSGEKADVRAGAGVPAGCDAFAADVAERQADAAAQEAAEEAAPQCDPNYEGACLKPDSIDYDCAGGSGDGPDYTGTVRIVGGDPHDLDRDGDGIACDT